jgi:crotonobetainyl-CoA:carnitine CoA-transferase CaiB-like acyl-CoA transferase
VNSTSVGSPLDGITVVEFGHSVAAPYGGQILADLGARVIKVENPDGGDYCRQWGPPFWGDTSSMFECLNRGKLSLAVDFANPKEAEALRRLIVEEADAVIQNLRAGALTRFGLDADTLRSLKPSLVWCDIGAFGKSGPLAHKPGYDPLMQAFTGIMSVTGTGAGDPVRVGVSMVDMGSGMWTVIGLLASLLGVAKGRKSSDVATSLFETGLAWGTVPLAAYAASNTMRRPYGSGVAEIVPYQAFETRDGWLMVAAGNDNLFRRLCDALDQPGLARDPRFLTNPERVANREILVPLLSELIAQRERADLEQRLDAAGVPNSPLQDIDQVIHHPQTREVGLLQPSDGDTLPLVGTPILLDGERPRTTVRAPKLGEHNAAILGKYLALAGERV